MEQKNGNQKNNIAGELSDTMLDGVAGGAGTIPPACQVCQKRDFCQTLYPIIGQDGNCSNFYQ